MSANSHQKIVRFYIPMDEVFVMDILNSTNHLNMCVLRETRTVEKIYKRFPRNKLIKDRLVWHG